MKLVSTKRLIEIKTNSDNFYRPEIIAMAAELLMLRQQYAELAEGVENTAAQIHETLEFVRSKK